MGYDIKSVPFSGQTPAEAYKKYMEARRTPSFDWKRFPELDRFWLYEQGKYHLWVIYGYE